jgi:hypothetical protein
MHRLVIYVVCNCLFAFLSSVPVFGAAPWEGCPDLQVFIEKTNPDHSSWKDLYRLFKTYQGCDDGAYAELYSDFVARSLTEHWNRLNELATLTSKDEAFKTFVLEHIRDETVSPYAPTILLNAQKKCPGTHIQLCSDIAKAALSTPDSNK